MEIISSKLEQSIKIIKLSGKIDTLTSDKLTPDVMKAVEENRGGVIFDLKEVTFVSSSGIRMFLSAFKKGLAENIKVAMIHINPSIYKIFKVAGLESMFNIFESEPQALNTIWGLKSE
jgi:anti-sigma B factor antagonist